MTIASLLKIKRSQGIKKKPCLYIYILIPKCLEIRGFQQTSKGFLVEVAIYTSFPILVAGWTTHSKKKRKIKKNSANRNISRRNRDNISINLQKHHHSKINVKKRLYISKQIFPALEKQLHLWFIFLEASRHRGRPYGSTVPGGLLLVINRLI